MTSTKALEIEGLKLYVPESWIVEESSAEITLRPLGPGGAVTISTYRHQDPGFRPDAVEQCARFVASRTNQDVEVRGTNTSASAEFSDEEGVWWLVRVITRMGRFALATYNTETHRDSEIGEARAILRSVVFVE